MSRRRWLIPLAALAIAIAPALASTAASASTHASGALAVQSGGTAQHVIKPGTAALGAHSGLRNETSSTNWSGYATDSGTYTSVSASWVQPTGTCSSRTDQYCINGKPQYYGWYETYPNPSYSFGSTVEPGDTITASTTYEGSNKFKLTLADTTRGWSTSTTQTVSGAARSSAEVIIEAPCCTSSGGILPLADFGTVHLSDSVVDGSPIGDLSPVQIYMTDSSGKTRDTVSSLSSEENFSATWVRAN
jgi:Peptidase A4 family